MDKDKAIFDLSSSKAAAQKKLLSSFFAPRGTQEAMPAVKREPAKSERVIYDLSLDDEAT